MPNFRAESLSVDLEKDGIALLGMDVPARSHNMFGRQVLAELDAALDFVSGDSTIKLLVIYSKKETGFAAGADLHEFTTITGPEEARAMSAAGQELFNKVADLRVPTVAVIHGPCLGGGLELALACDYRMVIDQPGTQLGLPEIKLGLIPGWGGTQRLPRVVGLERALQMILQSRQLSATEAIRWGLADAVQPTLEHALTFVRQQFAKQALEQGKRPKTRLPLSTWRQRWLESNPIGRGMVYRITDKILKRKVPDDMPAPLEAFEAVRLGLRQGMKAGLQREREAIGRLANTSACRNLVTLFFLIERARKGGLTPSQEAELRRQSPIRKVGVVGAGTMGAGIAQLAAFKGFEVVVQEVNEAALAAGMKKIEGLFGKAVERGLLSQEEAGRKLAAIGRTTTWDGFAGADLVIEAVIEEPSAKQAVFRELEQRTGPETILATNTSSLSVHKLLEGLRNPKRVAGLHFFNPVHKMPLVEVIRAPETDEAIIGILTQWAAAVGKTPVVVADSPGFVVNRILMPYLNEAGILLATGIPIGTVDAIMRRFGMPMGPLELLDQVGLDVAAHIARAVGPVFGERLSPHSALEQMVAWGWLGQKSGAGFYLYEGREPAANPKPKQVNGELQLRLFEQWKRTPEYNRRHGSIEEALKEDNKRPMEARERMVCLMVNEAAACLDEGLAERPDIIDLAMVMGTGWAPHRGGPLRYADDRGVADVVRTLEEFSRRWGPRFEPCAELKKRAASREAFYSYLSASLLQEQSP